MDGANSPAIKLSFNDTEVQRCRFDVYEKVRQLGPVYRDPSTGHFMVLDHDLVRTAFRDVERLSSEAGQVLVTNRPYQDRLNAITREKGYLPVGVLAFADPPNHTYQRALFDQVFSLHRVRQMEGYLEELTNEIIDEFIDDGKVEFFSKMATRVASTIISDQIGLPRSEIAKFLRWQAAYVGQANQGNTEEQDVAMTETLCEMQTYLATKAEEYRLEPAECMLSDLVTVKIDGRTLELQEIVSLATVLLVAGIGTTRAALSASVYRIATTPGLEDELRADFSKIPAFIEEVLRLDAPIQFVYRRARMDFELGGVAIPKDAIVCLGIGPANRDADTFVCPAEMHADRKNISRHLTFGHGPHLCVGKDLGRAEVRISLQNLLKRIKNIRLAEGEPGVERVLHFFTHSYEKLPIAFDKN